MPLSPSQLADELRGVVRGRLIADELARGLYATDASPFHILPAAVVVPADEDDLIAVVKYAYDRGVSITPRGAGTGLAGESLGAGIVADLSATFRTLGEVTADTVTVEPGVTLAELNVALAKHGRRFAPDPASGASCTLGGMIATNASGGSAFRHGYTRDHVVGLRAVLDEGRLFETGTPEPRLAGVATVLAENRQLLAAVQPFPPFNRCGYWLGNGGDPTRLIVGSEGTLAVVTRATLRTIPLPGGVCQFALGFATLDAALRAGPELRAAGLVACDVLDQRLLSLAKVALVPPNAGAVVLGTVEADTEREAVERGQRAVDRVRAAHPCIVIVEPSGEPKVLDRLRTFRDSAVSGLYALGRGRRPEAFVEDIAVPADQVPDFVAKVQEIFRAEELNASFLIHLLAGQVHTRPLLDVTVAADREKMWPLADRVHTLALEMKGTISTQHGVGLARTPWVEKQYGPLMPVFREIKRIFDPRNILNPGKIIGPDPSRPAWPMKGVWGLGSGVGPKTPSANKSSRFAGPSALAPVETAPQPSAEPPAAPPTRQPLLLWPGNSPHEEAAKCNGCGDCRPRAGAVRMCPVFRATGEEAATPRAKANVVKLLDDPTQLNGDEVEAVARRCVNCKMCRDECRAKVDVPKLMLEAKAAHYAEHGFNRHDWVLARAESLMRTASRFSWTVNTLLTVRWGRWLLEKAFGLSRRRRLPRFTHRTFLRRAWWAGWTRRPAAADNPRKVAYFVDVFANYCEPGIAEAAVAVLRHHGYEVVVPWQQRGSGMTPLSFGDADGARDAARYNLRALVDLARDGYTIVCTEPAAALAISQDYLALLDDPDAALVAKSTQELTAFLGDLHDRGDLKPPTRDLPVGIGHHVPCHVKASGKPAAAPRLLALIGGAAVDTIDAGCSGMAGAWGLSVHNHDRSLKAGGEMIAALDRPRILYGSTECSACRVQMEEATGKRTLHPVQYLAMAYGLVEMDLESSRPAPKTPRRG